MDQHSTTDRPPAGDRAPATSRPPSDGRAPAPRAGGLWTDALGRVAVRSAQILLVLAVVTALLWALTQVKLILVTVLIAVILAAAVSPVVGFLRRHGVPNALATWIALLVGIGSLAAVVWLVVSAVRDEWAELVSSAEEGLDQLDTFVTDTVGISSEQLASARQSAVEFVTSDRFQGGALAGASAAVEVVTGIVLGLVILFFLLRDGRKIWRFFLQPLDPTGRAKAERIGDDAAGVLGGYVRGVAIVALVDAVVIGVALAILGIPLALPLAIVVFLGAFIPLIGATIAGILAALVAFVSDGPITALIVIGVVVLVNQLEGDLLAPVVLGRALSLHPLAILLALTAGTILAGILGALLSVPIAAVAWTVISQWRAPDGHEAVEEGPADPPDGSSPSDGAGRRLAGGSSVAEPGSTSA